jgi:hypothetical protein
MKFQSLKIRQEKVLRNNKERWVDIEMKDYIKNRTQFYDKELN